MTGTADVEVEFPLCLARLEDVIDRAGQNHLLEAVDRIKSLRGQRLLSRRLTNLGHVLLVRHTDLTPSLLAYPNTHRCLVHSSAI